MTDFDQHGINHATVAIALEMTPGARQRHAGADVLFMGGCQTTDADRSELASFGLRKNYQVIFASFDPAAPGSGPIGLDAVVTDGLTQASTIAGGRLWKRDRCSPAVLLFPGLKAVIRVTGKGQLVVREMKGPYHDHGFDLAREAVTARAGREPGRVPVVSAIGTLVTVVDIRTVNQALQAA